MKLEVICSTGARGWEYGIGAKYIGSEVRHRC